MRILFIAPLPPPITGHAIAAQALLSHLQCDQVVQVVNLSVGSKHNGTITLKRLFAVLVVFIKVLLYSRKADRVYLTISQSVAGNLKDLILYMMIGKLSKFSIIHLHGGSFGKHILEYSPFLRNINQYYLKKLGAIVVSGPSHTKIFDDFIHPLRLHIIPNFAEDFMFVEPEQIEAKFNNFQSEIRILYVSEMTLGKGYQKLLEAYESMSDSLKSRIRLEFAGRFECELEKSSFVERILNQPMVFYHGVVCNVQKSKLFAQAHVFCLPTSFLEGQPISIIEAYASGCVVLTTPRPGILDIFSPSKNGFLISSEDLDLFKEVLSNTCLILPELRNIAILNRQLAEDKYRKNVFCKSLDSIVLDVN
jgi:glycosyltransferase involved in cell wall biosynthesis